MLDVVCSHIEVEPRVLASHLDYPYATYESHYPPDLLKRLNKEDYTGDLGGEIASPFQSFLGGSFLFRYGSAGLAVVVNRSKEKATGKSLQGCST